MAEDDLCTRIPMTVWTFAPERCTQELQSHLLMALTKARPLTWLAVLQQATSTSGWLAQTMTVHAHAWAWSLHEARLTSAFALMAMPHVVQGGPITIL